MTLCPHVAFFKVLRLMPDKNNFDENLTFTHYFEHYYDNKDP